MGGTLQIFVKNVRYILHERGMTVADFSRIDGVGLKQNTIYEVLSGRKPIGRKSMGKVADALKVPLDELIREKPERSESLDLMKLVEEIKNLSADNAILRQEVARLNRLLSEQKTDPLEGEATGSPGS